MAYRILHTIMACDDCALYVANDETPFDRPTLANEIEEYWMTGDGDYFVCGDWEQRDEFSWQPCECCGSKLGGARNQLHLMGA